MKSLFAALGTLCCCALSIQAEDLPNFVVILTDDQSWVGSSHQIVPDDPRTKSDYFLTPQMERLAELGMTFTQGYSPAASCCPTRRAIQVGQTPGRHEYHQDRDGWTKTYRKQLNIPRLLKAADTRYRTAHFGKWDHRYDGITPEEQGFDISDGNTGNGEGGAKGSGGPAARKDPKLVDAITDRSIAFLKENQKNGTPFYLQVSHYAVHLDIYYREETLEKMKSVPPGTKHNMPEFAAMTWDVDAAVGRVFDALSELGLKENTYVFFLSDNGGRTTMPGAPDRMEERNAPLRDGKHSFYEGGIRVPFLVSGPGVEAGSVCNVPVTGLDFLPTLAELSGYGESLSDTIDGGSLVSVLTQGDEGDVVRPRPYLVFHQGVDREPMSALRLGNHKVVKTWPIEGKRKGKVELFDLSEDISEHNDLSESLPEKAKELEDLLDQALAEMGAETRMTISKKKSQKKK
ncbi:MAG: sulfatase [Verrucomicrobiota bacterium]